MSVLAALPKLLNCFGLAVFSDGLDLCSSFLRPAKSMSENLTAMPLSGIFSF
ncbi:MAG: hypothetical protein WAX69_17100 [Victivallales bacterium]